MTSTTVRHEVEIDTQIAANYDAQATVDEQIHRAIDSLHSYVNDKSHYEGKILTWNMSTDEVLAAEPKPWYARQYAAAREKLAEGRERFAVLMDELETLNAQYTGWSRFFLVTSSAGGHIHRSMSCSTCHPTTRYGWLPQLSGLTEADAVADQGPLLCSVCFPTAPVEWTLGIQKPAKNYCSGSGKSTNDSWNRLYVACPDCGKYVTRGKYGDIRKHIAEKEAR